MEAEGLFPKLVYDRESAGGSSLLILAYHSSFDVELE